MTQKIKETCIIFSTCKSNDHIKQLYNINENIQKFIYLLLIRFNNKYYIKSGKSDSLYTRFTTLSNQLKKYDLNSIVYIIYCSKNTGDVCYEQTIKKEIEGLKLKSFKNIYKNIYNINGTDINGYTEIFEIDLLSENYYKCIDIYLKYKKQVDYNDSIHGKVMTNIYQKQDTYLIGGILTAVGIKHIYDLYQEYIKK